MSTRTKPQLHRDALSIATHCLTLAVVAIASGGLWMLVR